MAGFPAPSYPTPVRACPELSNERALLWIKNDGLSHPVYGGNKVRKAERLIREAVRRGAPRVLSIGAAGSHHLLALTLFARAAGLRSAAVVFAQPRSVHAVDTLRAAVGLGLEAHAARHPTLIPWTLGRTLELGDYWVAPGGSNEIGARACADAVDELVQQISDGALPTPDWIVVPLGSGGTCGGMAAGVLRLRLPCRVLGVQVVGGAGPSLAARWLARRVLRSSGSSGRAIKLAEQLVFDTTQLGSGYGKASRAGDRATELARDLGLELDPTYTAKAFAQVLELLSRAPSRAEQYGRPLRILYWHTLAATPLQPLLRAAPTEAELPRSLQQLFR
jgi:1-aminocyclopropane-1-carboxylate deaminase/D-cysteine desulfhydrase-like pyridoxal-dependent ACC family enzyme